MKPVDFHLHQPKTLDETLDLLATYGDTCKVMAGGQSLVPLLNFRLARPEHVIDIAHLASLGELRRTRTEVSVGSMVRQATAERSPGVAQHCPLLSAALPHIAHPPIRTRGTVGGSLAHADPAAELPSVAVALDATFVVASARGRREISAESFFHTHLVTALASDELLTEIRYPAAPPAHTGAAFVETARRRGDFALVGAGAQITVDGDRVERARVCISGVSDTPLRCRKVEELLHGTALHDDVLQDAVRDVRASVEPAADLHATADYRRHLAGVLLVRAVRQAYQRAMSDERPT